jgi:hypothetical protein
MSKFIILFIGGSIPENKKEQSVTDRLAWMNDLRKDGKFIDGSPLSSQGKMIINQTEVDYIHGGDSINGYAMIEASDINEALAYAKKAPQVEVAYGSAKAEVRPLQAIS